MTTMMRARTATRSHTAMRHGTTSSPSCIISLQSQFAFRVSVSILGQSGIRFRGFESPSFEGLGLRFWVSDLGFLVSDFGFLVSVFRFQGYGSSF